VPFPKARLDPALVAELRDTAPSIVEDDGDSLVIRHVYIERRMVPLNLYLERATDVERERAIVEYGDSEQVFANPADEYTRRLLAAIPQPDPSRR
jgi:isocitrate dehydrogenase kinase/phosphatase